MISSVKNSIAVMGHSERGYEAGIQIRFSSSKSVNSSDVLSVQGMWVSGHFLVSLSGLYTFLKSYENCLPQTLLLSGSVPIIIGYIGLIIVQPAIVALTLQTSQSVI